LNLDVSSGDIMGVAISNASIGIGERSTASGAFLNNHPNNLTIWTDSQVAKILIEDNAAVGIELINGTTGILEPLSQSLDQTSKRIHIC
jgi:hypothetical protein